MEGINPIGIQIAAGILQIIATVIALQSKFVSKDECRACKTASKDTCGLCKEVRDSKIDGIEDSIESFRSETRDEINEIQGSLVTHGTQITQMGTQIAVLVERGKGK